MKKIFTLVCVAVLALGCSKSDSDNAEQGYGSVELQCTASAMVDAVTKAQTDIAQYITVPDATAFKLHLSGTGSRGTVLDETFATLTEYNTSLTTNNTPQIENGENYTAEVSYGTVTEEGENKPYFYGTTQFTVIARKKTSASVNATIQNAAMTLTMTQAFKDYYSGGEASFTITTTAGNSFTFTASSAPMIFIQAGTTLKLSGTAYKQTGTKITWDPTEIGTTKANTFYTIQIDAKQASSGTINVTFSDVMTNVESSEINMEG